MKHSLIRPILEKHFEFDKIFDLLDYDQDYMALYREIQSLCRQEYQNNYRFIFLHYDTDYYITNDQPGLLLRNLQRILVHLDISNFFCLILSQQNLQPELDRLSLEETKNDIPIACITHYLQDLNYLPEQCQHINPGALTKNYICLNRVKRTHRRLIFSWLKHSNLLDKGLVSYASR